MNNENWTHYSFMVKMICCLLCKLIYKIIFYLPHHGGRSDVCVFSSKNMITVCLVWSWLGVPHWSPGYLPELSSSSFRAIPNPVNFEVCMYNCSKSGLFPASPQSFPWKAVFPLNVWGPWQSCPCPCLVSSGHSSAGWGAVLSLSLGYQHSL